MRLYLIIHYILILVSIFIVIFKKNKVNDIIVLFIASFDSIPIIYFGNSASGGIFLADIILGILLLKTILYRRHILNSYINKKMNVINGVFIVWIILCTVLSVTRELPIQTAYSLTTYSKFTVYGLVRVISYVIYMVIFFSYVLIKKEKKELLNKLFIILLIFCVFLILNQSEIINLSGIESLGNRIQHTMEILNKDFNSQIFLGTNKPNLGAVCYTIFWYFIYFLFKKEKVKTIYFLPISISFIALLGTQSRSDVLALIISLMFFTFITNKKMHKIIIKVAIGISYISIVALCIVFLFNINIKGEGLEYYVKSILFIERGVGSAGYRILLYESTLKFLLSNPIIMLLGLGPNCFRMLFGFENITTNFGHNTYLHNVAELGIIGAVIMAIMFIKLLLVIKRIIKKDCVFEFSCIIAFFIGRMVAGISVDTFFAVDTMLTSNIMLIGFIAIVYMTTETNYISKGELNE